MVQLDEALKALTNDLRFASQTIQADLDRFQRQKVTDIKEMCLDFARFHREWAAKVRPSVLSPALSFLSAWWAHVASPSGLAQNLALWEEAKAAIEAIQTD